MCLCGIQIHLSVSLFSLFPLMFHFNLVNNHKEWKSFKLYLLNFLCLCIFKSLYTISFTIIVILIILVWFCFMTIIKCVYPRNFKLLIKTTGLFVRHTIFLLYVYRNLRTIFVVSSEISSDNVVLSVDNVSSLPTMS